MVNDRRLIEDYLPIEAISAEASREKSIRKGHISTLHLWWARRPLVACRAAAYGALVPASRFVPENGTDQQKKSLGRANAAKFVERLCKYPGSPQVIAEAEKHILEAHAERLTEETGHRVTVEDIVEGRAPRPKVLDMFAGGGAIPLEALRLGCEAYAMDLNPVAHIIELCTLVYPQKYGRPDPNAKGMTGPNGTWGGLADEVRYWGNWVLEKVKAEIGDLYPPIPDPDAPKSRQELGESQTKLNGEGFESPGQQRLTVETPTGFLTPVAYLWTRTVQCKNSSCGATVPLVRQTWLCRKPEKKNKKGKITTPGRYVALRMIAPPGYKQVHFEVVESHRQNGLGFDPAAFSKAGNAACPFCGTVVTSDYVKAEGQAGRMGHQAMAIVCTRPGKQGKVYLSADGLEECLPDDQAILEQIKTLCERTGLTVPDEPIEANPRSMDTQYFGFQTWGDLFTPRQMLCLLTLTALIAAAERDIRKLGYEEERGQGVTTYLGFVLDRLADWNSSLCGWSPESTGGAKIGHTFGRQALPMLWDFAESAVWGDATGSAELCLQWVVKGLAEALMPGSPACVQRGSADSLPWDVESFDAVVTDPPYYDNVSYSNLSDFFYVWLKRTVGHLYPEHFSASATPKKKEAIAAYYRHSDRGKSREFYEHMMAQALTEAHRVLKPGAPLVVVYAHKTTFGWATLVDALRTSGFTVAEAWPLNTEMKARLIAVDTSALASSIFLVARKRDGMEAGAYETDVRPELESIVRERVEDLWQMKVSGADLVIAAVGAGLRAFTRFARVEYANGEEVPAERYLAEVEGIVLETLLEKIFGVPRSGLAAVDGPSRFYVLWRYTYGSNPLDAGEAIVFTWGQPVELDGPQGLAAGARPLVEKKKDKYRLEDFTERGENERLGLPNDDGTPAPLVDVLHRALWLMENRPRSLSDFLDQVQPDRERLRLVAQTLAGPQLSGNGPETNKLVTTTPPEQSALGKLLQNWRTLIEQRRPAGQRRLFDL